jgi:hypothetical protein
LLFVGDGKRVPPLLLPTKKVNHSGDSDLERLGSDEL